ncbi:MAG TPA: serine hydrolase domain-containing protein [Microthrixaceae bacterium]|nr:serine hydrolase domain-containing protein [Microthrixaceae bacterium]
MAVVTGTVGSGFEGVREAFETNFERNGDVGAGFALYLDGECVVDLVGGTRTVDGSEPYTADDLQLVFSSTKGATATAAHILVDRGELDLDAPVTEYWPEFGAKGKDGVPVSWLLCHRVGLPDVDRPMTFEQAIAWDPVVEALADSVPVWEPGTQHGYHAVTYGWLVGELIRRVSGKGLGQFFADEVAAPLDLDFWIGLPDEQHHRVVPLITMSAPEGIFPTEEGATPPGLAEMLDMLMGPGNLIGRALTAPGGAFTDQHIWNRPEIWRAEIGAANGITNARSMAKMYAATIGEVDGVRLFSQETLDRALVRQVEGADSVLIFEIPFGLGYMLNGGLLTVGSPDGFGHYGAGGSLGFADPVRGIAGAYVMNKMELGIAGDARTMGLLEAVNAALS